MRVMHQIFLVLHRLNLRFMVWMADYDLALLDRREQEVRAARVDLQERRDQLQMELIRMEDA